MPFDRPKITYSAPPEIVELADKYMGGFQTHLHVLASTGEIVSEEHRKGVLAECNAWLKNIENARGMTNHNAREVAYIKRWATRLN